MTDPRILNAIAEEVLPEDWQRLSVRYRHAREIVAALADAGFIILPSGPLPSGALTEVAAERAAQDARWGEQNHPNGTGASGDRMAANVARTACDMAHGAGLDTWRLILAEEVAEAFAESDPARLRAELVQVAAVATAWAEAIDRASA